MAGESDAASVAACLAPDAMGGGSDVAWAVSRLIGTMTIDRTVVVVLEDVHWADDLLLDVVEQLITHARRRSLLVVCTARPEFAERRPGWGAGANTMSLALERLDDTQTRVLLSHASPGLPAERAQRVIAAAEGNPLFAEHLAALIERGRRAGGAAPFDPGAPDRPAGGAARIRARAGERRRGGRTRVPGGRRGGARRAAGSASISTTSSSGS